MSKTWIRTQGAHTLRSLSADLMPHSARSVLAVFTALTGVLAALSPIALRAQAQDATHAVAVRAVVAHSTVHPGELVPVAVVLDYLQGFHSWPHKPVVPPEFAGLEPIPTTLDVTATPTGAEVGEIQWPVPEPVHVNYTGTPVELMSYTGHEVIYVPVTLARHQPVGNASVGLRFGYQACDERTCYPPVQVDLKVSLHVVAAGTAVSPPVEEPHVFTGFSLGGAAAATTHDTAAYINVFGWSFTFRPTGALGLVALLLIAALGGLLLNLTPCVLPLVPIKIMGLKSAAGSSSRLTVLGAAMGAGMVAFWLVLGGAVAFVTGFDAISSLFQMPWFTPLVGVVVAVAALSMLGLFDFRLPQGVYRIDPSAESVPGSFGFGVMTAVLSTPCTAPFMAGAAAWAALQRPPVTMAAFAAIGAGMALPYVLLTTHPEWLARVPRSGPGGVLLKQVMGLLMMAVAAFFIGSALAGMIQHQPDPPSHAYWWVVAGLVVVAFAWLAYRVGGAAGTRRWRLGLRIASGLAIVATLVLVRPLAGKGPIPWMGYTPGRFAAAQKRGEVIVMDFTAEWCLNCKALETGVLDTKRVVELLHSPGVVPMRVDLTTANPEGQAKLKELGWVGIPLLAVFGPGVGYAHPIRYDSYTPEMVEAAVRQATGGRRHTAPATPATAPDSGLTTPSAPSAARRPALTFADSARQATLGRAYALALHNLLDINTVAYDAAKYDATGFLADPPGTFVRAGGGYHQPWTRDASVNSWNAASLLEPAAARNTLWAVVTRRTDGALIVQQDKEWWDQCIWVVAAWNHYLVTGDRAFLKDAYRTAANTLTRRRAADYDGAYGLFEGPAFFNDGIAGYPAPPASDADSSSFVLDYRGAATQMTLSTNELYYQAYRSAALMARELQRPEREAAGLNAMADSLKVAINRRFWIPEKGLYGYFIHNGDGAPPGTLDESQEGAGEAFAILFRVANTARVRSILRHVHEARWGVPDVWPRFARFGAGHPGRHNVVVWPMVQGFWAEAEAEAGDATAFAREVTDLAALAEHSGVTALDAAGRANAADGSTGAGATERGGDFREIYNARTGAPDGGWQTGHRWASERNQTWSATAYLRMIHDGLFGMRFTPDGLVLRPTLPSGWGKVTLSGVRYRDMTLDMTLQGAGGAIARCTVDGVVTASCGVPASLRGEHSVVVTVTEG